MWMFVFVLVSLYTDRRRSNEMKNQSSICLLNKICIKNWKKTSHSHSLTVNQVNQTQNSIKNSTAKRENLHFHLSFFSFSLPVIKHLHVFFKNVAYNSLLRHCSSVANIAIWLLLVISDCALVLKNSPYKRSSPFAQEEQWNLFKNFQSTLVFVLVLSTSSSFINHQRVFIHTLVN